MKDLLNDKTHFNETHRRWMEKRNRIQEDVANYNDSWGLQQCFNCCYFIPLSGIFQNDYGGCSNEKSPFDKRVMFEHDGCEFHVVIENY